jgi:hypothetical protein
LSNTKLYFSPPSRPCDLKTINPGDRGAHRDRQRRRLKGKVFDVDLGRSSRDLLSDGAARHRQQNGSANPDETSPRERIAHLLPLLTPG